MVSLKYKDCNDEIKFTQVPLNFLKTFEVMEQFRKQFETSKLRSEAPPSLHFCDVTSDVIENDADDVDDAN